METLDCNGSLDCGPRVVAFEFEIFIYEVKYALTLRIYPHLWQRTRLTCQLKRHLFEMVAVDVDVAHSVDEISGLQSAYLGNHHSQESI